MGVFGDQYLSEIEYEYYSRAERSSCYEEISTRQVRYLDVVSE